MNIKQTEQAIELLNIAEHMLSPGSLDSFGSYVEHTEDMRDHLRVQLQTFLKALDIEALADPAEDIRAADEPVAYADPKAFDNFKAGLATHEWMWSFPDTGLVPLYRHAQRETVMPERKDLPDLMMASWHEAKGWNACLDEFTRLNGATS